MTTQIEINPYHEPLLIGASWYPEMWDAAEWPKDIARMRELGFNIVRVFEFAWKRMEPQEGAFDLEWATDLLDQCHAAGIKVMIGTPTAAPPAWLTEQYPEVLQCHADGSLETHGRRKHFNHHSALYREKCAKIVEEMCKAFGKHPAVYAWQIDNEMSGSDYGPETKELFHCWLKERFGSIEGLNEAWGLQFWSQAYDRFEQIPMVQSAVGSIEIPERHHPSLLMAQARFQNDGWTRFISLQCDVIRRYSAAPITSNMTESPGMHWYQHNRVLDAVGSSMYKDLAHYDWTLYLMDRMRAEKARPYWLLETAPNWSATGRIWNIHMHAEGLRTISWMSLLMGGSMILYWQWRQHWAGQEMLHGTLVTATGQWRPGVDAHRSLCKEVAEQESWLQANRAAPAEVAVVYSNESAWGVSIDPHDDDVVYTKRWRDEFYLPLVENHIWRDVICQEMEFSRYKVLIVPMLQILQPAALERLKDWVAKGGCLFVGPMTGSRTEEYTMRKDRVFGGLEDLIGAESLYSFPPKWVEQQTTISGPGLPESHPAVWCESWQPAGAEVLAEYRGGYGDGGAAIVRNRYGKGAVITCGTFVSKELYLALVNQLVDEAKVTRHSQGDARVVVVPRGQESGSPTGYGVINLNETPARVKLTAAGVDRLSGDQWQDWVELKPLQISLVEVQS
jgi:beta-galactosidase GanA